MKPRTTSPYNRFSWHRSEVMLVPIVLSLGVLTACVAPSPYGVETELPPEDGISSAGEPNSAGATYTPQPSASPADSSTSSFAFPMATCGERTSEPSGTWYSVFMDNGNVEDIRSRYCGDAISTTREKSGTPTVQVASFTSYARALTLAKAIGGVVEQTAVAAPSATGTYQNSDQPAANPPADSTQMEQSAFLKASDASTPINIRVSASTDAEVQSTGLTGERVQIFNRVQGDDGYTWYQVQSESGGAGWVRGDLVTAQAPAPNAPASQAPEYTPEPASQPPYTQQPSDFQQPPYAQPPYAQPPAQQPSYGQPPYAQPQQPSYGQPPYAQPQQPSYGQPPYAQQQPYAQQPPYPQPYAQPQQPSPYGVTPGNNRSSSLIARDPGAAINIRESASMHSRVRYLANPGDPVQVSGAAQGDDGHTWYQVRFASGAVGWVRSDLVANN